MEDEVREELIDQPLDGYSGPEGLVGPEGLLAELEKRLMNRVLDAELTAHLGRGSMPGPMAGTSAAARRFAATTGSLRSGFPGTARASSSRRPLRRGSAASTASTR